MKKWILLTTLIGIMFTTTSLFAGNGDLIVNGNLGVGLTNPASKLEVLGANNARITESSQSGTNGLYSDFLLRGTFSNYPADTSRRNVGLIRSGFSTGTWNTGYLSFGVAGSDCYTDGDTDPCTRMIITNNGNVGIGTTNPAYKLDVNGVINAAGGINTQGGASNYHGLGISSASNALSTADLDYNRAGAQPIQRINYHTGISMSAHSAYGGIRFYNQGYSPSNSNPYDSTIGAQMVMAINGGNVGIGTTTPGYTLTVEGNSWTKYGNWIGSDAKLKKNVLPLSDALDKILKLEGKSYEWKENYYKVKETPDGPEVIKNKSPEGIHFGVIAQEIEKVLPEVVKENADGIKAVAYTEIIPFLIEAIKEQQKIIEAQQLEIKEIKAGLAKVAH